MNDVRIKLREPRHVYPKVIVIPVTECGLDDLVHRGTALAGSAPADRNLDLDRRHRRSCHPHPVGILVATTPPRLLVRGGVR